MFRKRAQKKSSSWSKKLKNEKKSDKKMTSNQMDAGYAEKGEDDSMFHYMNKLKYSLKVLFVEFLLNLSLFLEACVHIVSPW